MHIINLEYRINQVGTNYNTQTKKYYSLKVIL